MTFKEWFFFAEAANPQNLLTFHGSNTGENNEVLDSFRRTGATPSGSGHGQGSGFYVWLRLADAQKHALDRVAGEFTAAGSTKGLPMVVAVRVPDLDPAQWSLDNEVHYATIWKRLLRYLPRIQKLPAFQVPAGFRGLEGNRFAGKPGQEVQWSQLKQPRGSRVMLPSLGNVRSGIDPPDPDFGVNIGDAEKVSVVYHYLKEQQPRLFQHLERMLFNKLVATKDQQPAAFKYTGTTPLPVEQVMVYQNNRWQTV